MGDNKPSSNSVQTEKTEEHAVDHPSRNLRPRAKGYGIGGGFEKPYRKRITPADQRSGSYGPVPPSGYYGAGAGAERFQRGEAGFKKELAWYGPQYGENTSGQPK